MPTTTKMGIVYPASTDLVKDGATAMGTISTTVDAKTGLVLLNTTSFSAVSSQSINDVFSTNFDNYVILWNLTHATGGDVNFRLRVSSTDAATNYTNQRLFGNATTVTTSSNSTTTSWPVNIGGGSGRKVNRIEIFGAFLTQSTGALNQFADIGNNYAGIHALGHSDATSYTGFSILPTAGTITGSVSTFGVNK